MANDPQNVNMTDQEDEVLFQNIPWKYVRRLSAFPAAAFLLVMLIELISCFIFGDPYLALLSNGLVFDELSLIVAILGLLTIIFYFGKKSGEGIRPLSLLKANLPAVFFLILILLMFASTAYNGMTNMALYGDSYRKENLLSFVIYFAAYFFCSSLIADRKIKKRICYLFLAVGFAIAVCSLAYVVSGALHLDWLHELTSCMTYSGTIVGIYAQINHYAYQLVFCVILSASLFISEEKIPLKIFCMISFIVFNIVLIANDSFGPYLACFVALIFNVIVLYIIDKRLNKTALLMIGLFVVISLVMSFWYDTIWHNVTTFFSDLTKVAASVQTDAQQAAADVGEDMYNGWRWRIWKYTVGYIKESPIFGHGIEGIGERLTQVFGNDRPHNEFLQYAAFFGIPAALMYIAGVFSVFLNGLKNKLYLDRYTLAALVAAFGYLVSSCFGNTMYYTAPLFFIFLGMGNMPYVEADETQSEKQPPDQEISDPTEKASEL